MIGTRPHRDGPTPRRGGLAPHPLPSASPAPMGQPALRRARHGGAPPGRASPSGRWPRVRPVTCHLRDKRGRARAGVHPARSCTVCCYSRPACEHSRQSGAPRRVYNEAPRRAAVPRSGRHRTDLIPGTRAATLRPPQQSSGRRPSPRSLTWVHGFGGGLLPPVGRHLTRPLPEPDFTLPRG